MLAALSVLHYVDQLGIGGAVSGYPLGPVRHSIDRLLFLSPALYAGFVLGRKAGWATCFVAYLVMLPRALFIPADRVAALFESTGVLVVGLVTCFLFDLRCDTERRDHEATAEMEALAQNLQAHVRLARSNEKRLATLNAISSLLGRSLDLDSVLRSALDMTMDVMEIEVALIFSVDDGTGELELMAHEGVSEEFARNAGRLKLDGGLEGDSVSATSAAALDEAFAGAGLSRLMATQEKIEAQLTVPLRSRGRIVGALCVGNRRPRRFLPEEAELLTVIGSQVGIAVENARLFREQRLVAEMLAKITDGSPLATFVISREHRITHWNTAIASLTGISGREAVGTDRQWQVFYPEKRPTMADLIVEGASPEDIGAYYQGNYRRHNLIEGAYEAESFFPTLGDSGRWLRFIASPIKNESGEIVAAIETLQDITEERQLQENMRFYVQLITRAQEEERKRLARDLHDETVQRLVAISHHLERLVGKKNRTPADEDRLMADLRKDVGVALQEVRHFTRDLRPPMLDDLGLLPALEWLASDLREQYGIDVSMRVTGNQRRLNPEAELLLFRIAQEALSNVRRHAAASCVVMTVEFDEGKAVLNVKDDGKGFQMPSTIGEFSRTGKLGILGMEERSRLLGGMMKVQSEPGKGTQVTVEVPL